MNGHVSDEIELARIMADARLILLRDWVNTRLNDEAKTLLKRHAR